MGTLQVVERRGLGLGGWCVYFLGVDFGSRFASTVTIFHVGKVVAFAGI